MARLLIVDDEKNIRANLASFFESIGHEVRDRRKRPQARAMIDAAPFDLVLTDFRMAEMNGLELLAEIKKRRPECLVILMTAYATVENAVAAMKAGAFDYVTKPFSLDQIQHLVERALQLQGLRAENRALRNAIDEAPLLESSSAAMVRLMETARQAAASEATVLLSGESGTGKNVLARQIHRWSPRHERPFVVVNCTTLSEELLESELFGHVRGAFTGAIKDKPGRLEAADGGTVFLDEIADLIRRAANQVPALRAGAELRARRRRSHYPRRHPHHRGLQPRPARGSRGAPVSRGSVLPAQRDHALGAAAARAPRGHRDRLRMDACRRQRAQPARADAAFAGGRRRAQELRLARQRARAAQRARTRGRAVPQRRHHARRSSRLDLPRSAGQPFRPARRQAASLEKIEREHITRVLAQSATLDEAAATLGINVTTLWRKRKRYGVD